MKKQLLHRVIKLSKLLASQKRKTRRTIELLKKKNAALVRENTQCVRKNKDLLGDLEEKKIQSQVWLENHVDLVKENAAQLAVVSRDRDAARAELSRLRVEGHLDDRELRAVRVEIDDILKRLKIAHIRYTAEQTVAKNNRMYCCPITLGLMHNPVTTSNGITYERVAIEKWLTTQVIENKPLVCPHRNHLVSTQLTPNLLVKNLITEAVDQEVARLSKPIRHPLG